jgi:hypothetical protein
MLDDHLRSLLDKPEDDCDQKFLEEEGFFRCFEKDMTLDWFIHPDYEFCSSLTDYQRLVLRNYVSYVLTSDASVVLQFIIIGQL